MSAQIIEKNGKPEWAVLPYEEYLCLLELAGEAQDLALYREAKGASVEEVIPAEVVNRLLDGDNPVKVWREYRGLSQRQLAERTGISHTYVSQLESGARSGSLETLRAIANALDVELDDLVPTASE